MSGSRLMSAVGWEIRWLKPSAGKPKCNIDAAFYDIDVGLGMCLRDENSMFVSAKTIKLGV
jgi:hypothetical protein